MFFVNETTNIKTSINEENLDNIRPEMKVISISSATVEEKTVKNTVVNSIAEDLKKIKLADNTELISSVDNKIFVSEEDYLDTFKVLILCAGRFQKVVYGQYNVGMIMNNYPEAERSYLVGVYDTEEEAKFVADFLIRDANISSWSYDEAKKILNRDGYSTFSFLQKYEIDTDYVSSLEEPPVYLHLKTIYKPERKYISYITLNNLDKFSAEIEKLFEEILDDVPYKSNYYSNNSCQINIELNNYEYLLSVLKSVEDFVRKNIYPNVKIGESLTVEASPSTRTYRKLPVSNICKGMALPKLVDGEIIPEKVKAVEKYTNRELCGKEKGIEVADTHKFVINNIVVPDNQN